MNYPNHNIRSYCLYLGSDNKYDYGVYISPDSHVSHAIVYGADDSEYISGNIEYPSMDRITQENRARYCLYLRNNKL